MLDVLVLKNAAECTSQRHKRTSEARAMNLSLSEYFCVVFLNLARGRETIKLPAVKTELWCIVFQLVWGQPRPVLRAAWYNSRCNVKLKAAYVTNTAPLQHCINRKCGQCMS